MGTLPALIEARVEFCVGAVVFIGRWFARFQTAPRWEGDDVFSIIAFICWAVLLGLVEYLATTGAPAGIPEQTRLQLPPAMVEQLTKGGKAMYVSFYFYCVMVYSLKACLLFFYQRFTAGLQWYNYVLGVSGCAAAGFIAAIVTLLAHCRPIGGNWQVLPYPGDECNNGYAQNIVIAAGNVITDGALLIVPFAVLWNAKIAILRKIKIVFLLSLGGAVIAMALVRCILTVRNPATINASSIWALRECLVAIIAVNAPILNTLFKPSRWKGSSQEYSSNISGSHELQNNRIRRTTNIEQRMSKDSSTEDLIIENGRQPKNNNLWSVKKTVEVSIDGGRSVRRK